MQNSNDRIIDFGLGQISKHLAVFKKFTYTTTKLTYSFKNYLAYSKLIPNYFEYVKLRLQIIQVMFLWGFA